MIDHLDGPGGNFTGMSLFAPSAVGHRREITGRGIDHLKHFGGCRLLLQRLARTVNIREFSIAMIA